MNTVVYSDNEEDHNRTIPDSNKSCITVDVNNSKVGLSSYSLLLKPEIQYPDCANFAVVYTSSSLIWIWYKREKLIQISTVYCWDS